MNWGMLGHEWAVGHLREQVALEKTNHAYLITGPSGVGRRTLALRLAQALNCTQRPDKGEFCGNCPNCRRIAKMEHPDLLVVQAERVGGVIKVEQVRELQRILALKPYEARYRVGLLLRFEEANPSASNALLKTLEEPASQVVLVLTAESAESLMPTIVSRCECIRLGPPSLATTSQGLQDLFGVPPEEARLAAHLSAGRPGAARMMLAEPGRMESRQEWLDDHRRLLKSSRLERFAYAERAVKDKETLRLLLQTWLSLWRDVMLQAAGASAPLTNLDREEECGILVQQVDLECARQVVADIERTVEFLDRNINPRLALEVLLLDLPRLVVS